MMKKYTFILGATILFFATCKPTQEVNNNEQKELKAMQAPMHVNTTVLNSVIWHQQSAEYVALCHQAFNAAKAYLKDSKSRGEDYSKSKVVVIMDIDEVILDNSPYFAQLVLNGEEDNPHSWKEWLSSSNANIVPGAVDFINFVNELGLELFVTSKRPKEYLDITLSNLHAYGIDAISERAFFSTEASDIIEKRREISDNYHIALIVGSKLSDFSRQYYDPHASDMQREAVNTMSNEFGQKFIILPNLISGDWDKMVTGDPLNPDADKPLIKGY